VNIKYRQESHLKCDSRSIAELCRKSIQLLEQGLGRPPAELQLDVDKVENLVAKVRDCFIQRLRQDQSSRNSRWRGPLDEINVAVSLIAAVEYPATGVNRVHTEQALKIIERIQRNVSDEV
jgi:hypothetical protein